jgi:hypothetical protein
MVHNNYLHSSHHVYIAARGKEEQEKILPPSNFRKLHGSTV